MNKTFRPRSNYGRGNGRGRNFRGRTPFKQRGRPRPYRQTNSRFQQEKHQNFNYSSSSVYDSDNKYHENTNAFHLDEDTRNYFIRVLESLQTGFENKSDEDIFVANVLVQTEEKELLLSCNKLGSQCLQRLLPLAESKPQAVVRFTREFSKDFFFVATHHFASHVIESVLKTSFKQVQLQRKEASFSKDEKSVCSELFSWILSVGNFFLENLDSLLYNLYASHVFSSLLQILSGQDINEDVVRSKRSREYNKNLLAETEQEGLSNAIQKFSGSSFKKLEPDTEIKIPEEFSELLNEIAKEFRQKNLPDLCMDKVSSPVLQALLIVLSKHKPKTCQKMLKTIIKEAACSIEDGKVSPFLTNQICSHVMERVVSLADEKRRRSFWKHLLKNNLKQIALHPIANFVLQKCHAAMQDTEQVEEILNELGPCFEEILMANHCGVVSSLSETCKRLKTGQAFFTKSIMTAFHCWEPEDRQIEIVPLLLNMVQYEEYISERTVVKVDCYDKIVNIYGSLILQNMLWFNKPNKVTNSILRMTSEDLRHVVCDPKGSRVVDAFVQSTYVGENCRDKLIPLLKPELVFISCNKNGSRSLDSIWEVATLKQKRMIAEELSKKENLVASDIYGRFCAKKIGLSCFKHRLRDWEQAQTVNNKKRKLFKDIIGERTSE